MNSDGVARFHAGDHALFEDLVKAHSPQLLGVAIQLTGDRSRAHDLVHDAWVRAFERRATFRGSGAFVGWMLAILRNCHRDGLRGEMRRETQAVQYGHELDTHYADASADITSDTAITTKAALDALSDLTDRQRDVVVMRVLQGKRVAETAAELGIAEGTVKATLSQSIERLRSILSQKRR